MSKICVAYNWCVSNEWLNFPSLIPLNLQQGVHLTNQNLILRCWTISRKIKLLSGHPFGGLAPSQTPVGGRRPLDPSSSISLNMSLKDVIQILWSCYSRSVYYFRNWKLNVLEVYTIFGTEGPRAWMCILFLELTPTGLELYAIGYWVLALGYWLVAIADCRLAIGYWLLAIGYWLMANGY